MIETDTLQQIDYRHLWHPYTGANAYEEGPFVCIERAEGLYLYEQGGRPLLDGISSWWATALGHSHPAIVEAIREQAGILQHSILGNMTHPTAIELAHRLSEITPEGLNRAYFASDGASATEAALKMAIQYWSNVGKSDKVRFVALEDGYHGDTLGAVGVGFVPQFHRPFEKAIRKAFTAKSPHCPCCAFDKRDNHCAIESFESMAALVQEHHATLAGVIVEPLCQGAAGMRIYPSEYLVKLRALCDQYDLLLIADEIAVGFGRTGSLFACDKAGIVPDILCLGKALTAGYLPMSATMASDRIFETFRNEPGHDRTFYDGHTFCGNPITSAAALAAIDIYTSQDIAEKCRPAARQLREGMERIGRHDCIHYQKSLGMIAMCAFNEEVGGAAFARKVTRRAYDLGLFIRPLGEVLYLWPPLISTSGDIDKMLELFDTAVQQTLNE